MVNLVDMNDNPPVFDKEEYRVTIRENIAPGTKLVQVRIKIKVYDDDDNVVDRPTPNSTYRTKT